MINEATRLFAQAHADDDVRLLALRGCNDEQVDMPLALQQIQGRQTARHKLPIWAALDNILYPPHLSMEQCSSETTARYKARIVKSLPARRLLVDLTGGFGVDFAWMSGGFDEAVYVERQPELMTVASENFKTLGIKATIVCDDAVDFLHRMDRHASLIFLDPARRDVSGQRTYGISDCVPNVLRILDELLEKSDRVMLKLSPMLDWRKAVSDVGACHVEEVHIVAVSNECKELLLLISAKGCPRPRLICVNDGQEFEVILSDTANSFNVSTPLRTITVPSFLYEPNAALMKAGFFAEVALRYAVEPLGPNSHLFVSHEKVKEFPGRSFRIDAVSTMNKQELRQHIMPLHQVNISVRNFPLSVAELRKRLKLDEGGDTYIFATTLATGERVLLVCHKETV